MRKMRAPVSAICSLGFCASSWGQSIDFVDSLPGTFIDISGGSTALNIGDDQEVLISGSGNGNQVFPTDFVVVGNNGGLGFRNPSVTDLAALNAPIPSGGAFAGGQALLAFWDDIDDKNGDVYASQLADRLIVQWNDRGVEATADTVTFQIQVFEQSIVGPGDIVAQIIYTDVEQLRPDGGISATIGYQDGGVGFGDFQWSFDTAGAVSNGSVLSVVVAPEPGTLLLLVMGAALFQSRAPSQMRR